MKQDTPYLRLIETCVCIYVYIFIFILYIWLYLLVSRSTATFSFEVFFSFLSLFIIYPTPQACLASWLVVKQDNPIVRNSNPVPHCHRLDGSWWVRHLWILWVEKTPCHATGAMGSLLGPYSIPQARFVNIAMDNPTWITCGWAHAVPRLRARPAAHVLGCLGWTHWGEEKSIDHAALPRNKKRN